MAAINQESKRFIGPNGDIYQRGELITENFAVEEWSDPMEGIAIVDMNFAEAIQELREEMNSPLQINSGCRTLATNNRVRGHPRSLHLVANPYHETEGCIACDISVHDWSRLELLHLLGRAKKLRLSIGHGYLIDSFNRVSGFVHLDDRSQALGLLQTDYIYKGKINALQR